MEPYIGQIELLAMNFAPVGWLACNGQLLSISGNETLYSLLGTYYGGDGVSTFALPNLNSRVPVGVGRGLNLPNIDLGQTGGAENATLTPDTMPAHVHVFQASDSTTSDTPKGLLPAATQDSAGADVLMYGTISSSVMAAGAVTMAGGSQPFGIRNPYLGLVYCIATEGVYPQSN